MSFVHLRRRRLLLAVSVLAVACGTREYRDDRPVRFTTAANCIVSNGDNLYTTGGYATRYLTVATGDPASPPWWEGGTTAEHPEWQRNDPYLGRGFEGAVAFEVAERLNFSEDDVRFVPIGFRESFAPGDKDFDFALQQIADVAASGEERRLQRGLLRRQPGTRVGARFTDRRRHVGPGPEGRRAGAPTGTGSLAYIEDTIHPKTPPTACTPISAAVRALQNGHVDGIVADLPNAAFVERPGHDGVLVGRLEHRHAGALRDDVRKGSPIGVREPRPRRDEGRRHARPSPTSVARGRDGRSADEP